MKKIILLVVLALGLIGLVNAQVLTDRGFAGAVIGGLAGAQVGHGNGRVASSAVGAYVGSRIAEQPQYGYGEQPVYAKRGYSNYDNGTCTREEYIDGNYNPPAAQAYCRGRLEKSHRDQERYEREAYRRGENGQ